MQAGTQIKVVVRLSNVDGQELSAIRLQPQTDAVFCAPTDPSTSIISAILAGDTSIVMGKPHEIRPGAIIQLAGAFDNQHRLHVKQVVILSGYVRISESPCAQ